MNVFELKKNLNYLVHTYIEDPNDVLQIMEKINRPGISNIKGIMHEFTEKSIEIKPEDAHIIKDIIYYYV